MKKTREQKGITLIALIITIVVLIILAVVTIDSIRSTGLIRHTEDSATKYKDKQKEENAILSEYENYINESLSNGNNGSDSSESGDNNISINDHVCWDHATSGGYSSWYEDGKAYHMWNDRSCTVCGSMLEDLSRGMAEECWFVNGYCSVCGQSRS